MKRTSLGPVLLSCAVMAATVMTAGPASAQPSGRVATTQEALRASAVFFHGKQIAVLGSAVESRDVSRLEPMGTNVDTNAQPTGSTTTGGIYVYWRERPSRSSGELRGEFWDLGRLSEGDTRFSAYDFRPLLEAANQGRWPGRDQLFVILGASMIEETLPQTATLRAVALAPERYQDRSVTVSGRFRGRNLYGDIAGPIPTPTKWDFVLHAADAATWISGMRPRGKGFELDPSARVDTGRWVQVAGTLRREGSRTWIEAREIDLASAPTETPVEIDLPVIAKEPPPTVVFTAPVPDEHDVETTAIVRIQFSRDMDARSFKSRINVSYQASPNAPAPPAPLTPPVWAFAYDVGNRGIELKFTKPLEPFQTVRIDLLEGIAAVGGDPLKPWTLTFSTGR